MSLPMTLVGWSLVFSLLYLAIGAAAAILMALRQGGRREESVDDHDALSMSRFTIPVSLVVPVSGPGSDVSATIAALLGLDYADFEVIVVAESLPAAEWEALKTAWDLKAREFYYRQMLPTAPIRKIYRSARAPHLMVVEKAAARSRADALNCGINLARFRYVGHVEPGVTFDSDALLRAMSLPLRDPARVVAATSYVETGIHSPFQRLSSIRALMGGRLVWPQLQATFGPQDGVSVWRRDAVMQAGGFSLSAADPDLDLMVRLQTSGASHGDGRVVCNPQVVGRTGRYPLRRVVLRTARRQVAALQALWTGRTLSRPACVYFAASEVLTPLVQAWLIVSTVWGALAGWLPWSAVVFTVVALSFGRAAVSAAALLLRSSAPEAPALGALLLVAPLDYAVSGLVAAFARTLGFIAFVRSAFGAEPV